MSINILDLPYDCLYYLVYNWCSVIDMHRKIKRLNTFFFELVHTIINSSKFNHNFIKNQQLLLNNAKYFYQSELECRKRRLTIHSISLKWSIKRRFRIMNSNLQTNFPKDERQLSREGQFEKNSTLNALNDLIEKKTKEKQSTEMRISQLQRKIRHINHTESRLKQNSFGPHFAWIMSRRGFYRIAEAGLLEFITFDTLPEHHICKLMDKKYHYVNLKYMLECRKDDIAWCWIDNTRNTPEMLAMIDHVFKQYGNYTKFKPVAVEIDVHCVYIRNDEPYFNQINRNKFI